MTAVKESVLVIYRIMPLGIRSRKLRDSIFVELPSKALFLDQLKSRLLSVFSAGTLHVDTVTHYYVISN